MTIVGCEHTILRVVAIVQKERSMLLAHLVLLVQLAVLHNKEGVVSGGEMRQRARTGEGGQGAQHLTGCQFPQSALIITTLRKQEPAVGAEQGVELLPHGWKDDGISQRLTGGRIPTAHHGFEVLPDATGHGQSDFAIWRETNGANLAQFLVYKFRADSFAGDAVPQPGFPARTNQDGPTIGMNVEGLRAAIKLIGNQGRP